MFQTLTEFINQKDLVELMKKELFKLFKKNFFLVVLFSHSFFHLYNRLFKLYIFHLDFKGGVNSFTNVS